MGLQNGTDLKYRKAIYVLLEIVISIKTYKGGDVKIKFRLLKFNLKYTIIKLIKG